MLERSIFNHYKKFFEFLIKQKKELKTLPEDEELMNIRKFELKTQLFLIRDYSVIEKIFIKSKLKTRDYKFKWRLQTINKELNIIKIIMQSKSNYQANYQVDYFYLVISEEDRFILPIGYVKSKYFDTRIVSFFKEFFPDISMSFLSQLEIKTLLSFYLNNEIYSYELELMIYRKASDRKKSTRRPFQRAVDYIGADLLSKISELEANKKYVDTVVLYFFNNKMKEGFKFLYNRYNKILWYNGASEYFIELLNYAYKITMEKFNLLDKRERKFTENHESKPIVLKLNTSIFSDKDTTEKFKESIEHFPKCNYAIISSGNPYLHIILRDQEDNSTYSIKNLGNRDLMVCPQIIGSNSSMIKILNLISERISEFEVIDYNKYQQEFHIQYNQ